MTTTGFLLQLLQLAIALLLALLLVGWVVMCRAWLQNKSAPSLLLLPHDTQAVPQGRRRRRACIAHIQDDALHRFSAMVLACDRPSLATDLPFARAAGASLVGCSLARVFMALARWTSAPRSDRWARGARCSSGFSPSRRADGAVHRFADLWFDVLPSIVVLPARSRYPSLAFAGVAFTMVSLAVRASIDNPAAPRAHDDRGDDPRVFGRPLALMNGRRRSSSSTIRASA
jgi:hypothetical protein